MSTIKPNLTLHPDFFEILFAHKSKVYSVFNDVLGLCDISHFAISHIDNQHKILTLSSTPSLEFNLFNSTLWRFDKTYHHQWYELCISSPWYTLYTPERYDELYFLKQIKHHYSIGLSMVIKVLDGYIIYSIASNKECLLTQKRFENQHADFYKIGAYCSNALLPLLLEHRIEGKHTTKIITSH